MYLNLDHALDDDDQSFKSLMHTDERVRIYHRVWHHAHVSEWRPR